jgi:glycine amidinotransferase
MTSDFEVVERPMPAQNLAQKPFSDNEWSKLIEVVVGRAANSCFPNIPVKALANIVPRYYLDEFVKPHNPIPQDIVEKAEAELDNFARILESYGVKVRRPEEVDWVKEGGYTGSMVRDGLMVVGNTIIEAAFSWPCRRREVELLHGPMLQEFAEKGTYHIVRAPVPPKPDHIFDVDPGSFWAINNSRIAFDTADFMRIGKHIVGHMSNATNQKGVDWVRAHLPAGYELLMFESHNQKEMHIDVTFVPLKQGTALYYPEYVKLEELRKFAPLDTWRLLPPPKKFPMPKYPPPYMASGCLAMNLLVLDGKRVFCYHDDQEMIQFLKRLDMEPIPIPFRHVGCLGGSFHCATLDLHRERI